MTAEFDPFTATLAEANLQVELGNKSALRQFAAATIINETRARLEAFPIDGIAQCARAGILPPTWLRNAFLRQYDRAKDFDVKTWDMAFGPTHGRSRAKKILQLNLWHYFASEKVMRNEAGYEKASKKFGISPKQVKNFLPKTRKNKPGNKAKSVQLNPELRANRPFG